LVFIQAGALHGVPMIFSEGLTARMRRSSGRISASSCSMPKCSSSKSVWPDGMSSYV